jgi:hypothetical protein
VSSAEEQLIEKVPCRSGETKSDIAYFLFLLFVLCCLGYTQPTPRSVEGYEKKERETTGARIGGGRGGPWVTYDGRERWRQEALQELLGDWLCEFVYVLFCSNRVDPRRHSTKEKDISVPSRYRRRRKPLRRERRHSHRWYHVNTLLQYPTISAIAHLASTSLFSSLPMETPLAREKKTNKNIGLIAAMLWYS